MRPILLLNSCFKLVSKLLLRQLNDVTTTHKLIHPSQMGGLKKHPTANHILPVLHALQASPKCYQLYIDFHKPFKSVVCSSLWRILGHCNVPVELIACLQLLYMHTHNALLVEGATPYQYEQMRGVRQGCPLSPLLFVLYLNVLLFNAPFPHPSTALSHTSHSFIDDLLCRSTDPALIQKHIDSCDTAGRKMGMAMNMSKTEVQALNGASRQKFTSPTGPVFDTHDSPTNSPREFHKYLGVFIFTNSHPQTLPALAQREVSSFFTRLQLIPLTSPELVPLVVSLPVHPGSVLPPHCPSPNPE